MRAKFSESEPNVQGTGDALINWLAEFPKRDSKNH